MMPKSIQKISMFLLAISPILWVYQSTLEQPYPDVIFIFYIFFCIFRYKGKILFRYPKGYKTFWVYAAIAYIVVSLNSFKLTAFIPGGWGLCLYSVILGFVISSFDINYFRKYYRLVFFIAALFIFF